MAMTGTRFTILPDGGFHALAWLDPFVKCLCIIQNCQLKSPKPLKVTLKNMWSFLRPTRAKLGAAGVLWFTYWLIGRIDSLIALPLLHLLSPGYLSRVINGFGPPTKTLMTLFDENLQGAKDLFIALRAVHIVVAGILGYLGACLIALLMKNSKAI